MDEKSIIKRYQEIDALRGIAIFLVLLFHYTSRYDQIYGHTDMLFSFPYGVQAVQLFFMISGFVIYICHWKISKIVMGFFKKNIKTLSCILVISFYLVHKCIYLDLAWETSFLS